MSQKVIYNRKCMNIVVVYYSFPICVKNNQEVSTLSYSTFSIFLQVRVPNQRYSMCKWNNNFGLRLVLILSNV